MAILGTFRVSSEVDNYTLAELLDLLGSPKGVKDTLANLEKVSKKANRAINDLAKAENDRDNKMDAENREREKEINAIHKDKEALAAAWAKFEADTTANDKRNQEDWKALKRDQEEYKLKETQLAKATEYMENTREQLARDQEKVGGMVAEAGRGAIVDRKVAEKAKADAKRLNTEANRKMAEMRKLVA
jgi:chromosome segregation ATPase